MMNYCTVGKMVTYQQKTKTKNVLAKKKIKFLVFILKSIFSAKVLKLRKFWREIVYFAPSFFCNAPICCYFSNCVWKKSWIICFSIEKYLVFLAQKINVFCVIFKNRIFLELGDTKNHEETSLFIFQSSTYVLNVQTKNNLCGSFDWATYWKTSFSQTNFGCSLWKRQYLSLASFLWLKIISAQFSNII